MTPALTLIVVIALAEIIFLTTRWAIFYHWEKKDREKEESK